MSDYQTRVGAYAVCVDDDRRMLVARIGPDYPAAGEWTLPGGGLEYGEHPADAAIRELREETGYEGRIVQLLDIASEPIPAEQRVTRKVDLHVIFILYRVEITGGELRYELDGSTDEAAWVSEAELERLTVVPIVELARQKVLGSAEGVA